ncbi:hypothetical protein B9T28_03780 [Acinetobacter silvestris]|uniref:Uncharacterized protein n=1 Tax=Acinetobacter silvestris TaxID=1977882 RepID=A0A1Y3CIF0_9GAMM|nr:hypothetical protein [Acinetobacter silvestris]OTG66388.1 hypothetical protein B9T28_03780 [Acinetobacter silvestris]
MRPINLILLSLVFTSYSAHASSEAAWKKNDQNLKTACIKVSQLKNTKVVSDIISFDDQVGYSALVLEGNYPQAHMKNKLGRELCLWQRAKQKAFIAEADTLLKLKK